MRIYIYIYFYISICAHVYIHICKESESPDVVPKAM